jgi:hypothetical protein
MKTQTTYWKALLAASALAVYECPHSLSNH